MKQTGRRNGISVWHILFVLIQLFLPSRESNYGNGVNERICGGAYKPCFGESRESNSWRGRIGVLGVHAAKEKTYYEILGVAKDCDEKTLKKNYKKLALKWHPDKNPDDKEKAEAEFQKIAEAYTVLSDPEKRKRYDQFGKEGVDNPGGGHPGQGGGFQGGGFPGGGSFSFSFGGGGQRMNAHDVFNSMFGEEFFGHGSGRRGRGGFPGGGGFGGGGRQQQHPPMYSKADGVKLLTLNKFPDENARYFWLIEFYAPWCGHCQRLKPEWVALANNPSVLKVGAVNCDDEEQLCQQHGIRSFPTIMLIVNGRGIPFDGQERTQSKIKHWALASLPSYLSQVTLDKEFEKLLRRSGEVDYKASGLIVSVKADMPAIARAIGYKYRGRISFGYAWKEKAKSLLQRLGLESVEAPYLIVFCGGDESRTVPYTGESFKFKELDSFLEQFSNKDQKKIGGLCSTIQPKPPMKLDASTDVSKMKLGELKRVIASYGSNCDGCIEKSDFVRKVKSLAF